MNPGDVVLIALPQIGGSVPKLRPALLLASLPGPYQNLLLCGISTQLHHLESNWDELVQPHRASIVRLSYIYAADPTEITGVIGRIDPVSLHRLRQRLSDHVRP